MAKKEKEQKEKSTKKPEYEVQFASQAIAKKVRNKERRNKVSVILIALLIAILALTGVIWGALQFVEYNSVQIAVGDKSRGMISLYSEDNFSEHNGDQIISPAGPKRMGDCTYQWIDVQSIADGKSTSGSETAEYIGFTFYARNTTDKELQYVSEIVIPNETKRLGDAVRIMVVIYDNNKQVLHQNCYARTDKNGKAEKVVPFAFGDIHASTNPDVAAVEQSDTTPFYVDNPNGTSIVMHMEDTEALTLAGGMWHQYVVLMWLEGEDADCVDAVDQGRLSLRIDLNSVETEE